MSTKKSVTIPEICAVIWQIEKDLDLLKWQINGINIWKLVRFQVYIELTQKTSAFQQAHPKLAKLKKFSLSTTLSLFKNSLFKTLYQPKSVDYIIMPHQRQVNGVDIYTQDLMAELADKKILQLYSDHRPTQYKNSYNITGYIIWALIKRKIAERLRISKKPTIQKESTDKINQINGYFKQNLNVTLNLESIIYNKLFKFSASHSAYTYILKKAKPKAVFMVTGYAHEAMIAAAQQDNIPVYELQHGTMTPFHVGYSYPGSPVVPYAPNYILTYGKFWTDFTDLPKNMTPIVVGSKHISNLREEVKNKVPKQVLVISQGTIGDELFKVISNAAKELPDYQFIYRLHPSEEVELYNTLYKQLSTPGNVSISDEHGITYKLMQESEYVISVYSTALIEALALDCKGVIITLNGHEYFKSLIENKEVLIAENSHQLAQRLPGAYKCKNKDYYYAPFQMKTIINKKLL